MFARVLAMIVDEVCAVRRRCDLQSTVGKRFDEQIELLVVPLQGERNEKETRARRSANKEDAPITPNERKGKVLSAVSRDTRMFSFRSPLTCSSFLQPCCPRARTRNVLNDQRARVFGFVLSGGNAARCSLSNFSHVRSARWLICITFWHFSSPQRLHTNFRCY